MRLVGLAGNQPWDMEPRVPRHQGRLSANMVAAEGGALWAHTRASQVCF